MKKIRQIKFTGKNLNDVFNLPCVKNIMKYESIVECVPILILDRLKVEVNSKTTVEVGDTLVQYANGKWAVE